MKGNARRATLTGLASAALVASLTMGAASASAIDTVYPCGPDFLKIRIHYTDYASFDQCYANAGEAFVDYSSPKRAMWVTKIETGNNVVQWYGDGRWQPAAPIGKWTTYTWPNHPNGV
ncbi:beta/gamma crystallin domain-containing protein, partial [Streptomyces sp. IBSBF 2394]|uniref:beta/gamma crystallin domain-containing protein n=1 Tax=Streptomyces sp. IBSBF 2394 TaxID=2903532 RepID=UPI002FDC32AF